MEKIELAEGLTKEIVSVGHGETPPNHARVIVHYVGKLEDGTVFDSSRSRGVPFEFLVGTGQVIKAWDIAIPTMCVGETAVVTCAPEYAYGDKGYKTPQARIPPGATLTFKIELISFRLLMQDVESQSGFVSVGNLANEVDKGGEPTGEGPVQVTSNQAWWERVNEVETYCSNCKENGTTRILPTVIPNFKEILVMSFECPHCGYRNTECRSATEIQEKGVRYDLKVTNIKDLNRQIIKGEYASIYVPEIGFEIPPHTQKGSINTIEGVFSAAIEGLKELQTQREVEDPETAHKLNDFINKLTFYMEGNHLPFEIILDDPCGNSFLENQMAPKSDPHLKEVHYTRTNAQQEFLGLAGYRSYEEVKATEREASHRSVQDMRLFFDASTMKTTKEVLHFPSICNACSAPGETLMCITDVPHFKEIILMCHLCEYCQYKTVEVKAGGGIAPLGRKIVLKCKKENKEVDMKRDVLKSDTSAILIPELDLSMEIGTLGGMYTTMEGLLDQMRKNLELVAPFQGDSTTDATRGAWTNLLTKLRYFSTSDEEMTIILIDPCANSWIYSPFAPEVDPFLEITDYERTEEEMETLGLSEMKTEGYEAIHEIKEVEEVNEEVGDKEER